MGRDGGADGGGWSGTELTMAPHLGAAAEEEEERAGRADSASARLARFRGGTAPPPGGSLRPQDGGRGRGLAVRA